MTLESGDPAIIDLSILANIIGPDPVKQKRISLKFIESVHKSLIEIETALASENLAALGSIGHKIMAAARSVGAMGYADLCYALEQAGKKGDLKQAQEIVPQFHPLLLQIDTEVKRLLP